MLVLTIDLAGVAELSGVIFFSIVIVTLALMFAASLLFWTRYPQDLRSSAE